MKPDCIAILNDLTQKKSLFFTDRGNTAILLSIKLARSLGKKRLVIQDQGGWITYEQYAKRLKLELVRMKTDLGLVMKAELKKVLQNDDILLMNSMPGYYALQENMKDIYGICKGKDAFLINDASGSIGTDACRHGDVILGSFGEWKPVEVKYGGFIAFDDPSYGEFFVQNNARPVVEFYERLLPELKRLHEKQIMMFNTSARIKKELQDEKIQKILHAGSKGYNVIVAFSDDAEKEKIIGYCVQNELEYTMCPRYIRVIENAVSIELKR